MLISTLQAPSLCWAACTLAQAAALSACCPALGAPMHTSCSCSSSQGDSSTDNSSSRRAKGVQGQRAARVREIINRKLDCVPTALQTGDRTVLSQSQREDLALLRHFNISQPFLRGQVILAKVLRSTPQQLLVDPGYYGFNVLSRQELASAVAYDERGSPILRRGPASILPGDYVKVRLSAFNTPYGDAQLDPVGVPHDVRQKLVWEELAHRMSKGITVKGRVLNSTKGGYAVAVAGYVALLPRTQLAAMDTRPIGVLRDFYIHKMDSQRREIELTNMQRQGMHDMEEVYKQTL